MANAIATADRAGLGSRDQARRLPAEARRGLVGIRFERLRATAKAVDLLDGEDRRREPLKPQGSYVRARVSRPRLQIGRFRRCSLPALQQ